MKHISEDAFAAYRRGWIDRGQFIEHLFRDGGREKIVVGAYLAPCIPGEIMDNKGDQVS